MRVTDGNEGRPAGRWLEPIMERNHGRKRY